MRWPLALLAALIATPASAAPPPIVAWSYTVASGDTLASIAARMGVSTLALAHANGIDPDARLMPGTVLKRPDPADMPRARPSVRRDAPAVRTAPPPRTAPVPRSATPRPTPVPPPPPPPDPGAPALAWPTSGAVIAPFGTRVHGHAGNGIDLVAFAGMTVRAAAAGEVVFAGTEPERYGQLIVIDHGHGWASVYAYLGRVTITAGAHVRAGEPIARIGTSGEVHKPTLHFELRHDNVPQNPIPALPLRL
jgi:lipoprotein NlpD